MNASNSPILLAQCKAFHPIEDIYKEIESLLKIESNKEFNIHVSLPYSFIEPTAKKFEEDHIRVGAEILLDADEGSFTRSIAGRLLDEIGAKFVMIGSVQDRTSHSQTSHPLKIKVEVALKGKAQVFICIGESLQEHQDKTGKQVLVAQLKDCLKGIPAEELDNIYIVYNAEWISRTPWEAKSPELHGAYQTFRDAITEVIAPESLVHKHLIVAIPAYSNDIAQLIRSLKSAPTPFYGYSVGILGSSAEYLQPLIDKASIPSNDAHSIAQKTPINLEEKPNIAAVEITKELSTMVATTTPDTEIIALEADMTEDKPVKKRIRKKVQEVNENENENKNEIPLE